MKKLVSIAILQLRTVINPLSFRATGLVLFLILQGTLVGCRTAQQGLVPAPAIQTNSLASAKGKTYRVLVTAEQDRFIERERESVSARAITGHSMASDDFNGTDREASKTSLSAAPMESFSNLADLIASLPPDDAMLNHNPPITKASDSQRVSEEQRNVSVGAFLYAAKGEADHDFHLILGTTTQTGSSDFLNAEISGLPPEEPFRSQLMAPRDAFKSFFSNQLPSSSGYSRFDPPIPVLVSGSVFYDIDHKPGAVGPHDIAPKTSWEIHPISSLVFEPSAGPPVVTTISPATGDQGGGTTVTITGSGFTGATSVGFGANIATSMTVTRDSSITAVSPQGTGTVDVTVITPLGQSQTGTADQFTYQQPPALPVITAIDPTTGAPGGGTTVTITGSGFTGATNVTFGATDATSITVNSDTTITAVSPQGTGTVDVKVITPPGQSQTTTADQFTYQ